MTFTLDQVQVYVTSYLHQFGRRDDGAPFVGEVYHLLAEDADGNRWEHGVHFPGVEVELDDEGYDTFIDTRTYAIARAEALLARVVERGSIDLDHWVAGRPAYGSNAYQDYGQLDDLMWEREMG